jgi:hypothetical protein
MSPSAGNSAATFSWMAQGGRAADPPFRRRACYRRHLLDRFQRNQRRKFFEPLRYLQTKLGRACNQARFGIFPDARKQLHHRGWPQKLFALHSVADGLEIDCSAFQGGTEPIVFDFLSECVNGRGGDRPIAGATAQVSR